MASKILIVEDSPITRIVLRAKLARAFYTPLAAEDGASALAALNETRPDLLLLDLELPDMSGLDVLARLRADRTHAATPVIVITACTEVTPGSAFSRGKYTVYVTFTDGAVIAGMATPDMQVPIAHCLGWPQRVPTGARSRVRSRRGRRRAPRPDAPAVARATSPRGPG